MTAGSKVVPEGMKRNERPITKMAALILALLTVAGLGVCFAFLAYFHRTVDLVRFQMAGSSGAVNDLLAEIHSGSPLGKVRSAVLHDFGFIAAFTFTFGFAGYLGRRVLWTPALRLWSAIAIAATVLGAAANLAQDLLLLRVLSDHSYPVWVYLSIQALAFVKFSALLVVAIPIGLAALLTVCGRLVMSFWTGKGWPELGPVEPSGHPRVIPPAPLEFPSWAERVADVRQRDAEERWNRAHPDRPVAKPGDGDAYWQQNAQVPPTRKPALVGICASGGGVRSATITLGALQALRDKEQLQRAGYLVSVSGGGYMAGAFQLALRPSPAGSGGPPAGQPADVFEPGSVEEDHVRRHSSYLSDGPKQWLVALGVLLRGLLSSFLLMGLVATLLGLILASFYAVTKIADLGSLKPQFVASAAASPSYPTPADGVLLAIAVAAGMALLAYLLDLLWVTASGRSEKVVGVTAASLAGLTILLTVVGVAIPAVVWLSAWLTWKIPFLSGAHPVAATGSLALLFSYFGTLAATLWRKRQSIAQVAKLPSKIPSSVVPSSMAQRLVMWIALLVLALGLLLVSGWVASSGAYTSLVVWWVTLGLFVVAMALIDQTWLSLHPFYRRRLATAFAVRRGRRDGDAVAVPYPWEEGTSLVPYAEKVEGFPKVIFAATANVNGQDRTAPGRQAVSFTLADDYIGGPQVGWVATEALLPGDPREDGRERDLLSVHLQHDLTVEAAVAISGAAFASAMGRQTRFYEVFLTLVNARLGAWLPNPYFVWLKSGNVGDWRIPGFPWLRRLSYYARELFGIHPTTSRLLLCTDGGHYENLGLVELLRHRCRLIYCIDGSGDTPPMATTLAQAITLAKEELGVRIELETPRDLVPGGGKPLDPDGPLAALNARLSAASVCIGHITYPKPVHYEPDGKNPPIESDTGLLVFAKSNITDDTPYEVLSYAIDNTAFPRDSTADQWFDGDQFDAYQRLGYVMGTTAVSAWEAEEKREAEELKKAKEQRLAEESKNAAAHGLGKLVSRAREHRTGDP